MKKNRIKFLLTLVTALAIVSAFSAPAAARIDVDREGSILLDYRHDGMALPDVEFELYRAADVAEDSRLTLSGGFKDYPVRIEGLDDSGWRAAAATLATYVRADQIQPDLIMKTDEQGTIDFGMVRTGLYLIVGQEKTVDGRIFQVDPFLASLPGLTEDDGWSYDVLVKPKCSVSTTPVTPGGPGGGGGNGGGEKGRLTVVKVWNDDGFRELRPESIEAALVRDGEIYQTVTLNAANYWRHTWSGLDDAYSWEIVEDDVSEYYTVTYDEDDTKYTITNSILQEIEEGDVPTGLLTIPEEEVPMLRLPQTGLLQWPIPLLAASGLVLFALGWKDYSGKRKERDEV